MDIDYLKNIADCKLNRKYTKISNEFKIFLKDLSNGKCPTCHREIKKIDYKKECRDSQRILYLKFDCGHKHTFVNLKEEIKVWEMISTKDNKSKNKASFLTKQGTEESTNKSKYPKGVWKSMIIDRKNKKYDQVVKDLNTKKIVHEEHQDLREHR